MSRPVCEYHDKTLYTSKREARACLTGGLKGKRIWVYECDEHPGSFHISKEGRRYQKDYLTRRHTKRKV